MCYTYSSIYNGMEPFVSILFNIMGYFLQIFNKDEQESCKPSPIISNSKAIIAL